MQPAEILRRLEHPFQMLTGGGRGAPQRQQTLLASVRWSYDLCTEAERRVWARLATFAGDFELEAAEAVGELAAGQVLDVVTSLVDKSVLMREDHGGTYGFRLLAPVREFGLAKLRESGETTLVYRRHRAYFEQLTMKMRADWVSPRQAVWLARLARGHANLRTVLQFCLDEPGEAPHALAILVSLPYQYWWNRGLIAEGRYWLGRALDLVREPSVLRARALLVGCNLANGQRSFDPGALQEARQLALRFGDRRTLVLVANIAGLEAQWRGDLPAALSEFEQMLSNAAGGVDLHLEIQAYMLLASAHCRRGDLERTRACYEAVVRRAEPRGELFSRHYAAASMGIAAWRHGDLDEAERCFHDMLSCAHRLDNSDSIAWGLDLLAWTAARAGRFPRAATMLGAAGALWDVIGRERLQDPHLYGYHVECGQSVRDALGDTEAEAASRHGRAMTLEDAVRYALGDDRGSATGFRPSPASAVRLTGRERQVADLVAEGLTNRLVAARLVISRRTAESHVENILAKLGFTARAQIAAWAAEHRAGEDSA
jgi:non-specific serine/threonine protein kinase